VKSWSVPAPAKIAGLAPALSLMDTGTGTIRATDPQGAARMYVCGITPYDATHMGHAATYVAFDMVQRVWRDGGHPVLYVQNVTDIDDPLLERAVALGEDWQSIAERETALFREDMAALNVLPPDHYIGAVEAIPSVAGYVQSLQERGVVYAVDEDLYFSVGSDPAFGSVAHLDEQEMIRVFAERGGDPDRPGKRHPLDCLLWQAARPQEPSWDTALGHGRPGWHIECTAIALDYLGMGIDVQGGGSDLVFPHHEMGASEAQVIRDEYPYAKHYVHSGMVGWQGHKMSKSRGNLVFVSVLRHEGHDPMAIRLSLLAHHYRSNWAWTPHGLQGATDRLGLWRSAVACTSGDSAAPAIERIREHLTNDLQSAAALDVMDAWSVKALTGTGTDAEAPAQMAAMCDSLLGVRL
jgi:L-cysteine:1D-myo-inositol 2-amino-2-deoxy-alpha-D-glucopyranoside ligase